MRTLQSQAGWCARAQWVLGSFFIVLCAAFYLFVYRPGTARQHELRAQIDLKTREIESNRRETSIRNTLQLEVDELHRRLARFDKQLPRQVEWGQFLNDITLLRDQAGLRDCHIIPTGAKPNDLFVEFPIHVKFEGDFLSVFSFLRQMEQMQRLTRVRDLSMRTKRPGSGVVDVSLSMNIYYTER
ncbi:MAG TPA: type 4a pilus biogenesis protein PilO [Tepidisphaeraceae bacterium]|nr:type 4a pilus biogenesis protein PilO [Tepidisphaeraceae bacterium]